MNRGRRIKENYKPMPLQESILITFVLTFLGLSTFYLIQPFLEKQGLYELWAYIISLSLVFLVMICWTIFGLKREGISLKNFWLRLRLVKVESRTWVWAVGVGLLFIISEAWFSPVLSNLVQASVLPIPQGLPSFVDPVAQQSLSALKNQMMEEGILYIVPFALILNIFGEELFWRGYVMPRQELVHRRKTWLIHGLMWTFSHLFQYWLLPSQVIGFLALSYLVQRYRNTWLGIIAHFISNGLPILILVLLPV